MICIFNHKDLQFVLSRIKQNRFIFYPLEVVGHGGKTQLQVGEHFGGGLL